MAPFLEIGDPISITGCSILQLADIRSSHNRNMTAGARCVGRPWTRPGCTTAGSHASPVGHSSDVNRRWLSEINEYLKYLK